MNEKVNGIKRKDERFEKRKKVKLKMPRSSMAKIERGIYEADKETGVLIKIKELDK